MKNFSYNTEPQQMSVEEVLLSRKKRLRKQQIVFGCIFAAVLLILAIYVVRRVVYTYYDGYIKLDQNNMRAVDDLFVLRIYKEVGDRVEAGDTLYSYVLIDNLLEHQNVIAVPGMVGDYHKMQVQAELAAAEVPVLRVRLQELDKRLKNEENDVYYGVTDNTQKLMLQAERKEVEERLKEQYRKIAIYRRMAAKASKDLLQSGYGTDFLPNAPGGNNVSQYLVKYACAPKDAVVTDIKVAEETVVFHKEGIIDLQHDDYAACNLGVIAYIPSNKIPKHLVSNFAHDIDAVIAYFTFLPGQQVPFWVLTDNLPVRVRTNNFQAEDEEFASRILEIRENNQVVPSDSIYQEGDNNL